jgi:hypothetical protein
MDYFFSFRNSQVMRELQRYRIARAQLTRV